KEKGKKGAGDSARRPVFRSPRAPAAGTRNRLPLFPLNFLLFPLNFFLRAARGGPERAEAAAIRKGVAIVPAAEGLPVPPLALAVMANGGSRRVLQRQGPAS